MLLLKAGALRTLRIIMHSQPQPRKISVLIADDHPMMIVGIRSVLTTHSGIEVVGEAANAEEAVSKARDLRPDVLLMDISMPGMSGIEAANTLHHDAPDVKIIFLTMHDEKEYIDQFRQTSARGFVVKNGPPGELLQAIEAVDKGGAFFSPQISKFLLNKNNDQAIGTDTINSLTVRERQILTLVAKGFSSKQMAENLLISARTVGKHRETLMKKLKVHTVAELTQIAISSKMVEIRAH